MKKVDIGKICQIEETDKVLVQFENKTIDHNDPITMTSQGPMLMSKYISQIIENTEGAY